MPADVKPRLATSSLRSSETRRRACLYLRLWEKKNNVWPPTMKQVILDLFVHIQVSLKFECIST
jgi:hypothetical protein